MVMKSESEIWKPVMAKGEKI